MKQALIIIIFTIPFIICKSSTKKETVTEVPSEIESFKEVETKDPDTGVKKTEVVNEEGEPVKDGPIKSRYLFEHTEARPDEAFRVYMTSDEYIVKQFLFQDSIARKEDTGGDQYVRESLVPFNKVNFSDEMSLKLILSPWTGNISRVSVEQVTRIRKVTSIIHDDATRWTFTFPKKVIHPKEFKVYYFVALYGEADKEEIKKYLKSRVLNW